MMVRQIVVIIKQQFYCFTTTKITSMFVLSKKCLCIKKLHKIEIEIYSTLVYTNSSDYHILLL